MSSVDSNSNLNFDFTWQDEGALAVQHYTAGYKDKNGNHWLIDCAGTREATSELVTKRQLYLTASREIKGGHARRQTKATKWMEQAVQEWFNSFNLKQSQANFRKQTRKVGKLSVSKVDKRKRQNIIPALSLTFKLEKRNIEEGPLVIEWLHDPITPYSATFNLQGTDATANVDYHVIGSNQIALSMNGPKTIAAAAASGFFGSISAVGPIESAWTILVNGVEGESTFTLRGDIVVN